MPAFVLNRGGQFFVSLATGRHFQIYDVESLNLQFSSPELDSDISCICASGDYTFVACKRYIEVFERAIPVKKLKIGNEELLSIISLGDWILGLSEKRLYLFNMVTSINCEYSIDFADQASCFIHPNTYLNKVLVGFRTGRLELWNIKTKTIIHAFPKFPSCIISIAQSPVNDVVAVVLDSGDVWLLDILRAKRLFCLSNSTSVTCAGFRLDGVSQLAVGLSTGEIIIWDLDSKIIVERIAAHVKSVASLWFIPGHPILLSNSSDNSVKIWIADPVYRLLKQRHGHLDCPTVVKFYEEHGKTLLSGGMEGNLFLTSLIKASQSYQLSYGSEGKIRKNVNETRLKPIADLDVSRDLKWDNIISVHKNSELALGWRGDLKSIGKHILTSANCEKFTTSIISPCGNFGILGSNNGSIYIFNLQSGLLKRSNSNDGIEGAVRGFLVRSDCGTLLTAYESGLVEMRDFKTLRAISHFKIGSCISKTCALPSNDLIGLGAVNGDIVVFDLEFGKIVRKFSPNKQMDIQGLAISADCKSIVCIYRQQEVWIWDFITGNVLNVTKTEDEPVAMDISPGSELIAMSFKEGVGISLWTNNIRGFGTLIYSTVQSLTYSHRNELKNGFLTFNELSKWLGLLHIDEAKKRAKPIEQASAVSIPFFMDAYFEDKTKNVTLAFQEEKVTLASQNGVLEDPRHKKHTTTKLEALLYEFQDKKIGIQSITEYLTGLLVNQMDFELKMLTGNGGTLSIFIEYLIEGLKSMQHFDAYQAFMNVVLKFHYDSIVEGLLQPEKEMGSPLPKLLPELLSVHRAGWMSIEAKLQEAACLESFCKNDFY